VISNAPARCLHLTLGSWTSNAGRIEEMLVRLPIFEMGTHRIGAVSVTD